MTSTRGTPGKSGRRWVRTGPADVNSARRGGSDGGGSSRAASGSRGGSDTSRAGVGSEGGAASRPAPVSRDALALRAGSWAAWRGGVTADSRAASRGGVTAGCRTASRGGVAAGSRATSRGGVAAGASSRDGVASAAGAGGAAGGLLACRQGPRPLAPRLDDRGARRGEHRQVFPNLRREEESPGRRDHQREGKRGREPREESP